nr:MAG TPA: hypothetical protein [Caudoviricetes sp.]
MVKKVRADGKLTPIYARDKLAAKCTIKALKPQIKERLAEECLKELNLLKNHI